MRFGGLFSALTISLALFSPRTVLADDDDRARFAASFRYVGSTNEQAARRAAIDRGIQTLFFAIRGIARSRLSDNTKIEPWVAFSFDMDTIHVRDPSGDVVSPSGATVDHHGSSGDRAKLSQRISAGKITQTFVADQGQRINEWVLSPESSTLSLKVTVSSPKLSQPVVYTLTYERVR